MTLVQAIADILGDSLILIPSKMTQYAHLYLLEEVAQAYKIYNKTNSRLI